MVNLESQKLQEIRNDLGASVRAAVLDTGIDSEHPDFSHLRSRLEQNARGFVSGDTGWRDGHGHGTHVASILCGSGKASSGAGRIGVAPYTDLFVGKVLDDNGSGSTLDIVEGMRWAAVEAKADIISMSLGGGMGCRGDCLLCSTADLLSEEYGTLFVVKRGGNSGGDDAGGAVWYAYLPCNASLPVVVGAGDLECRIAPFSSRGKSQNPNRKGPDVYYPRRRH